MIHKLILRNFKKVKEETFLFNNFDLIVGSNNSGKSTVLQALAIWQFCVEQFRLTRKKGQNGIQIVLPNFTALPVPEFNLLWKDKTDRRYEDDATTGKKNQIYIYIEIDVYWKNPNGEEKNFCVQMRYQSPQAVYAKPLRGWVEFNQLDQNNDMPYIVYVPPFSGLEPHEKWLGDGNVRQNVGKAQPGSVLRNLLYRVISNSDVPPENNLEWIEIIKRIKEWFNIDLLPPQYDPQTSTEIVVEYQSERKNFDIISGGSGFHQILTLLAFMYGYKRITTILFDEPDAHLHVNLQRQIINYFRQSQIQFLIATHSEEFIKNVEINSILSILSGTPNRIISNSAIISALSDINNIDIVRTQENPYILYLEGEDDARILASWAKTLGKTEIYQKFYSFILGGSTKKEMKEKADKHYQALKQIIPNLKRAILLDYDNDGVAFHPTEREFPVLNEWKRKNIDNYLLVPDAWKRAVRTIIKQDGLFLQPYYNVIDSFFEEQNLTLPRGSTWSNIRAQIFSVLDGKKLLFENQDSLFQRIKSIDNCDLKINRSAIASAMTADELHEDIALFFDNLTTILQ
jgi:predicted ATPase